ncbi:hypothetical protein O999_04920 [Pseudomonas putida LF54]|uniref:hypothetical protein n=1 Tax=Pseudomonas putida TaxID=303 RepID=UPI0003AF1CDF|nr:hypothetical protein [Pseudomonas putida]ERL03068.1 hypothetical protein O999_04920 [Pseudomonas putida LF54]
MKPATFKLDRHVFELLKDGDFQEFTIRSLRDGYACRMHSPVNDVDLWRYVYDQAQRLKRVGWVRQDPVRRRRDQIFHVMEMPQNLALVLVDQRFATTAPKDPIEASPLQTSRAHGDDCPRRRLQSLANEIRLDMLTALGEAERYKQLFTEMPALKARVQDDYVEARDRSSRLLGHLRAIENTLKLLVAA